MKNATFDITFDRETGLMSALTLSNDADRMNWLADKGTIGQLHHTTHARCVASDEMKCIHFEETDDTAVSVFTDDYVETTLTHRFAGECLVQEFKLKNVSGTVLFLNENNFSIEAAFNDRYTTADDCMIHRCNTHLWCGGNSTYIDALKMGVSELNMGLVVTKGSFVNYRVLDCHCSNDRGRFLLNLEQTELLSCEEVTVEWVLFPHAGKEDFIRKALEYGAFIDIKAEHFTVFQGDVIRFRAQNRTAAQNVRVYTEEEELAFTIKDGAVLVEWRPDKTGEYRIYVEMNGLRTWTDFAVKPDFETLLEKRIHYIIDHQQYKKKGSPLNGAYLIYDIKMKHPIFENDFADRNACRERIGMALLICKYLQTHENEKFRASLASYIAFLKREFYDEETGTVYNTIGKDANQKRLYNAPWVGTLFMEMYKLTSDEWYLDNILKLYVTYYEAGGSTFYPNAVSIRETANVFKHAGRMADYERIVSLFKVHVDNIARNKTSYPPHEVNYEQTIVTPATTLISEFAELSGDKKYAEEAKCHVLVLERFSGHQPSFHLNQIPIRYWDDFWFGKLMTYGDTFPHYWSCLSARSFNDYYKISGETRYLDMARECMRNCLCLFADDGTASAAYLYPYKLDDTFGEAYDGWANDQDFALYFALETGAIG